MEKVERRILNISVNGKLFSMTQDERWINRYDEVKSFIEANHQNPSRHRIEEYDMLNRL